MVNSLADFWNGKNPLEHAFWRFFIPMQVVLVLSDRLLIDLLNPALLLIFLLPTFSLYCFSIVSVWRCAPNHGNPSAPYTMLARLIAVLLGVLWGLPIGLIIFLSVIG